MNPPITDVIARKKFQTAVFVLERWLETISDDAIHGTPDPSKLRLQLNAFGHACVDTADYLGDAKDGA